jgi:hypothetical protein
MDDAELTDTTEIIQAAVHAVELARRRMMESLIDAATPYIGIVEEVAADGQTVRVRRVDEVAGSGRWVAKPAGSRPVVGTQLPIVLTTGLNARGQIETVGIASPPLGGDFTGGFGVGGTLAVENPSGTSTVKIGKTGAAETPTLDFDSSAFVNGADARITALGGTAAPLGGALYFQAATLVHNDVAVWDTRSAVGAVGATHLGVDAVQTQHITTDAVGSNELATASVRSEHLAPSAVVGGKITDGTIGPTKLDRAYSVVGHDHDDRYYTQVAADNRYYTKNVADGRYATAAHTHAGVYSPVGHDHDSRYYTQGQSDANYYSKATADTRYLSKTAALDHNGTTAGFMGAAPVSRRAAPAVLATDGTATNAQLATAINTLRSGLINLGLFG